ncbi:YeiH family protein [Nonomuraea sp. NBC_00507]|uniref:putative sulfate exporter family transporter n=1 Tax=Nonomuraea sp. NBC_00507 TaxID=2976002 RepID=UPI002E19D912
MSKQPRSGAAATRFLEQGVPSWFEGNALAKAIEFPVYAIALGLLGNAVLTATGLRDRPAGGFRTEFFIKPGLVLLGASINLKVIVTAAGSVQAKREQLAYSASLVIAFALPSIFILPTLASLLGLSPEVAGAWIGGNIDTTAAVTAAGTIVGEDALAIATIVKITQNAPPTGRRWTASSPRCATSSPAPASSTCT